jgi:WD40 repeat protein
MVQSKCWSQITRVACLASLFIIFISTSLSQTALPPQSTAARTLSLQIETGTHLAAINAIGLNDACTLAATGSDDKTVRLWATPNQPGGKFQLLRTFRPQSGSGQTGRVSAIALSPDGKLIAAGVMGDGAAPGRVLVIDHAAGTVTALLISAVTVHDLRFSASGRFIAAALGSGEGVRVWETARGALLLEDRDYGKQDSLAVLFDDAGYLYSAAFDGYLRRYDTQFQLTHREKTRSGGRPSSLAVHPSQRTIAVGYADAAQADVYNSAELNFLFRATTGEGTAAQVAWSYDGQQLYTGGGTPNRGKTILRAVSQSGRGEAKPIPLDISGAMRLASCGEGLFMATRDPALGVFTSRDNAPRWERPARHDFRAAQCGGLKLAADGLGIQFPSMASATGSGTFDLGILSYLTADQASRDQQTYYPATQKGIYIPGWEQNCPEGGQGVPGPARHDGKALALAPDRSFFVIGSGATLLAYEKDGREIWRNNVASDVMGLNISRDNRLLAAAHADGTLRWYRLSDGRELLALFVSPLNDSWILWTPGGYFTASTENAPADAAPAAKQSDPYPLLSRLTPGGSKLIGWQLNHGPDALADFFPAGQFRRRFERPDLIIKLLRNFENSNAISELGDALAANPPQDIMLQLPPVVEVLSPSNGQRITQTQVTLRYSTRSPSGRAITRLRILVDGRPYEEAKGFSPVAAGAAPGTLAFGEKIITLPKRNVLLAVIAETGEAASDPVLLNLRWDGAADAPPSELKRYGRPKGNLYALLAGVSQYRLASLNLSFAHKDAQDLSERLQSQKGRIYNDVQIRLLTNEKANRAAIAEGLAWLRSKVTDKDIAVVFLSGHGATDDAANYFFLPHDAEFDSGARLPKRGSVIADTEIRDTLQSLRGQSLFFFDTCHAGSASGIRFSSSKVPGLEGGQDFNRTINDFASPDAGIFVLASSTGRELSQERDDWRNGAFTKSLIEGLRGDADVNGDGLVSIDELSLYVKNNVKKLTEGKQNPVDQRPKPVPDIVFFDLLQN